MLQHAKQGCFGRLTVRASCCKRNIFKKPCAFGEVEIFTFCGAVLYEGSMEGFEWKMPIFCPRPQFLAGSSHAPAIFSKSARDSSLIVMIITGSTTCNTIFQVSNRTIRCILDRSGWRLLGGFCMNLPIISWVTRAMLGCPPIFP